MLGTAALLAGACKKSGRRSAPEPGEPGTESGRGEPEDVPRFVPDAPVELPPQPPEVVIGPCQPGPGAGGGSAPYATSIPAELGRKVGALLGCYRTSLAKSPQLRGRLDAALTIAGDGKISKADVSGGVEPGVEACLAGALALGQLPPPPPPAPLELTCALALLPEHALAHQPIEPGPILRLGAGKLLLDGQPVALQDLAQAGSRLLIEAEPEARAGEVLRVLAALGPRDVGFVVVRGARRYQLVALEQRRAKDWAVTVAVEPDGFWVGTGPGDRRQIRNQAPGAYDYGALTATLAQVRSKGPLWNRFDAQVVPVEGVSYDVLTRALEAAVAAGFVDFVVAPRSPFTR